MLDNSGVGARPGWSFRRGPWPGRTAGGSEPSYSQRNFQSPAPDRQVRQDRRHRRSRTRSGGRRKNSGPLRGNPRTRPGHVGQLAVPRTGGRRGAGRLAAASPGPTPAMASSVGARSIAAKKDRRLTVPAFAVIYQSGSPSDQRRTNAPLVEHGLRPAERAADPAPGSGPLSEQTRISVLFRRAVAVADVVEERAQLLIHRIEHAQVPAVFCVRRHDAAAGERKGECTSSGQTFT